MAILLATNEARDFSAGAFGNTKTEAYDSDYVSGYIEIENIANAANPMIVSTQEDVSSATQVWFHFDCWLPPTFSSSADGFWFTLNDIDGNEVAQLEASNGYFNCQCHGTNSSADVPLPVETLTSFDFGFIDNGDGTDTFKWYQNGVLIDQQTSSRSAGDSMPHRIIFSHVDMHAIATDSFLRYSQFIIADEPTIGMKLSELAADSIGSYTDVSSSISEVNDGNLTTGWFSNTAGDKNSFITESFTPLAGEVVHSVVPAGVLRSGITGPQNLEAFVRIGGADYYYGEAKEGVDHSGNVAFAFTTNPATGVAWTSAEVAAGIEIGFEFKA